MTPQANLGILIPNSYADSLPRPEELTRFFREAEELGFHSLWITDRLSHPVKVLTPLVVLSWAAAVTSRIRLGTAVLLLTLRNPVEVAKTASVLDYLSGGRLTLGISLGGLDREYQAMGVPMKERVGRLRESIALLRRLWSEREVSFKGKYFKVENIILEPKPIQQPIPLLMGAAVDPALRRTAELSDGWIAGSRLTVEEFRMGWQKVQEYARAMGRDPATLQSAKLLYMAVGRDRQQARARLEAFIYPYYGRDYDLDRFCVYGTPEECLPRIRAFFQAGLQTLILGLTRPEVDELRLIAREIAPALG